MPYINHPLNMACQALALGLNDDTLIAAILLHDVSEDSGVAPGDLPVCEEARTIAGLLTKPKGAYSEEAYYAAIAENPKACLVKCIDRCNNLSCMAFGFSPSKIREYIAETERYYPALFAVLKQIPEYNNAAWLLTCQMRSVIQTAMRIG